MPYIPFKGGGRYFNYYRTTEQNELNQRSIFSSQERIKMLHARLSRVFKFDFMLKLNLLSDFSPLHDYFLLLGQKKYRMLRPVIDSENILDDSEDSYTKKVFQTGVNQDAKRLEELFDRL
jgi:hypothetical protein